MAINVTITSKRRNHHVVPVTLAAGATWQTINFPDWVRRVEVINYGADTLYVHTDVEDGDAFVSGVELPSGNSYAFPAAGADRPYLAVRHASGSYVIGLAMYADEEG